MYNPIAPSAFPYTGVLGVTLVIMLIATSHVCYQCGCEGAAIVLLNGDTSSVTVNRSFVSVGDYCHYDDCLINYPNATIRWDRLVTSQTPLNYFERFRVIANVHVATIILLIMCHVIYLGFVIAQKIIVIIR